MGGAQQAFHGRMFVHRFTLITKQQNTFSCKLLTGGQGVESVGNRKKNPKPNISPAGKAIPCLLPGGRMGSEGPHVGKLLPWGPPTPEGEGRLLARTRGPQAVDLPAVGALPPPCPHPLPVTRGDVTGNNALLLAPCLRWRRPGIRHHNDSHFLGNRESHLYLCWEPPHLELSCDSGSYF